MNTRPHDPLPKNFDFSAAEPDIYAAWEEGGFFRADPAAPGESFVIVIPPPNVTGNLHMGHALDVTLQDVLTRYHRMKGDNTLWLPGTDHAGIATQNVVEKTLLKEGTSREELGREKFVERVWEWKRQYGGNIVRQLRRLGGSCDWSRERFTMDEGLSRAVREVFVTLHEEGLVYRGQYLINWCPRCRTAVSDVEVEHENRRDHLYYLKYVVEPDPGGAASSLPPLVVATTRPETCFGDTAVAVNPDDPRFGEYLGRRVVIPLTGRSVPVVADAYVDMEFGTGALKVTPGHDPNDFQIARRHDLPAVSAIDEGGLLTGAAGPYRGLDRLEARPKIVADLERAGLLERTDPLEHAVGVCYRCRSVIEPLISLQWFVKIGSLAGAAREAVADGRTALVPAGWEKTYFDWMDNIRDWCVSRQLWWGHQIPAWYCQKCGETIVAREDPAGCPKCGGTELERDPDVLDTWFSSGLWPFSTLGWPERTADLARYYPTTVLVTGFDIIFFWVARMMMMGLKFMGDVPFRTVILHPLVRDAQGKKMSKTAGNVVDPLEVIDRHGADAFRFSLAVQAGQARDLRVDPKRVEGYSKFVNKIWNAARLADSLLRGGAAETTAAATPGTTPAAPATPAGPGAGTAAGTADARGSLPDRWIRARLNQVVKAVGLELDAFHTDRYCDQLYQFVWYEFCDWYLELVKPVAYGPDGPARRAALETLGSSFATILKLLHPVMPFVTEALWPRFAPAGWDLSPIMTQPFPQFDPRALDPEALDLIQCLMDVTRAVRQARSDFGLPPGAKLSPAVQTTDPARRNALSEHGPLLLKLMGAESLSLADDETPRPRESAVNVLPWGQVWTPLAGHVNPEAELARLEKESQKIRKEIAAARGKLQNPAYLDKAPEEVVAETREKLSEVERKLESLGRALELVRSLA
ncbi:MAG: valine--tRNA ligase [Deltaproteobacteria bacterium]|nr:valine--tRNA ligase [Deltaproteobacteria bacterium]